MTDLEITKLCAEAMELPTPTEHQGCIWVGATFYNYSGFAHKKLEIPERRGGLRYDPLHDDAQAMALVKKFQLTLCWWKASGWDVSWEGKRGRGAAAGGNDLNHAICECVAKMQAAK